MAELRLSMKVWDAPIRLFHWGIVILVCLSYLSLQMNWMRVHFISGYTMIAALLFRLAWGFVGSDTARFAAFLKSPLAALQHLAHLRRREPDNEIGHNAAGGWMVLGLLLLLAVQAVTGLFSNDDVIVDGPLVKYVGKRISDRITNIHAFNFNLILIAVGLHVLAVLTYFLVKRHNLLRPMITGKKRLPAAMQAPRMRSPLLAAGLFAAAVAMVVIFANWV